MRSHTRARVLKKTGFVTMSVLCEIISVNCSNLRNYFHGDDLGGCAYKRQRASVQVRSVGEGGGESGVAKKWFAIYFSHPWTPFLTWLFKATCAIVLQRVPRHVNAHAPSLKRAMEIASRTLAVAAPRL